MKGFKSLQGKSYRKAALRATYFKRGETSTAAEFRERTDGKVLGITQERRLHLKKVPIWEIWSAGGVIGGEDISSAGPPTVKGRPRGLPHPPEDET